jgi:hypothetical protein
MSTSLLLDLASNYTRFLSDIEISNSYTPSYPKVFLSSKLDVESKFYNSVYFDKDISIYGKINNTGLTTISNNIKYITSTSVDTMLNSRFKIQDVDNSALYTVFLSNDDSDTSYIKSSLNVHRDMTIGGILYNNALNNTINTISSYVNTISSYVLDISQNIELTNSIANYSANTVDSLSGVVYTTISSKINTISGVVYNTISSNVQSLSGRLHTLSGQVSSNNLNNVITVTGNAQTGYTINIGNALSTIYLNGVNLYYNGEKLLTQDTTDNQVTFGEYISRI